MATTTFHAAGRSGETTAQRMSWGEDLITVLLGAWLMAGLAVDGWAHTNLPGLETFFTPWHAVFYSGFAATALWITWRTKRRLVPGRSFAEAVPKGYGLGLVGLGLFAVGGIGDMIWHVIFGIEVQIDALMSPTHLLLFAGVVLVVTSPFRAAWNTPGAGVSRSLAAFLPVLGSLTLASALAAFMFMYLSPFLDMDMGAGQNRSLNQAFGGDRVGYARYLSLRGGIAAFMVTTVILFAPVLLMLRRWRTPMFSLAVMFGLVATLIQGISGFARPWVILVAVAGGLGADLLAAKLNLAVSGRRSFRIFAGVAPMILWAVYILGIAATEGIGWEIEFWTGVVGWAGLAGLGLSLLVWPSQIPEETAPPH